MSPALRRVLRCLLLLCLTVCVGIAVRYAPLHLPWFWTKYLGSALWAAAVYWCVALFLPGESPGAVLRVAALVALLVEGSRLFPERHIDAFRLTLPGKLLLGRYFSWRNLVAYAAGLALAAALDRRSAGGRPGGKRR